MRVAAVAWKKVSRTPGGLSRVTIRRPGVTNPSHCRSPARVAFAGDSAAFAGWASVRDICNLLSLSVRREWRVRRQKCGSLSRERLVILKQGTMSGVRIRQEHRVRQVLAQPVGVRDRNHFVVDSVDDKRRLLDALQLGKGGAAGLLPFTKRSHLRRGNVGAGWCVEVLRASCKPLDERRAGRLARRSRGKEDLLQHGVSLE